MSESRPLVRPHYFSGRLLAPEDLNQEQTYFREKHKRHNRSLHGFGIVNGLDVSTDSGGVVVSAGLAIDCRGNEIVLEENQRLLPAAMGSSEVAFVAIKYREVFSGPMIGGESATIVEGSEVVVESQNQNGGHRHLRGRWLPCGEDHSLTVARLKRGQRGWRIDRRYRPPAAK